MPIYDMLIRNIFLFWPFGIIRNPSDIILTKALFIPLTKLTKT